MLSLKNIYKDYVTGDTVVNALKGVSLDFRKNEFVSVLGASGCGKTTLLNIVGGLDRYTSGDLVINGVSTKEYTDGDWDAYRNHTVGFVFQTYNLIMHQTVLGNVELALTLSGVSPAERRALATEALTKVGLGDQLNKKPNQLSGGQMQRVAIARAIVNDPDIILADEPTGALDTATSVQIMDILKELAEDRLVIMVTHNPELAEKYSTRIVRLSDGELLSDTNPPLECEIVGLSEDTARKTDGENNQKPPKTRKNSGKKSAMSFMTALTLSFKNLLTKKARTILVSFAGSIGIIGIALILSLSDGFQAYINKVQEDTLSTYPLTIESETVDASAMMESLLDTATNKNEDKDEGYIYANSIMQGMLKSMIGQQVKNDLKGFNKALMEDVEIQKSITAIKRTYDMQLQIYYEGTEPLNAAGKNIQVNPSKMISSIFGTYSSMAGSMVGMSVNTWAEMLDNQELLESQYQLVGEGSKWPTKPNEVVVVVDSNEEINDYILYSLGILDQKDLEEMMEKIQNKEEYTPVTHKYSYEDILGLKYKLVYNKDQYNFDNSNPNARVTAKTEAEMATAIANGYTVEVVGIIKPKASAAATSISGTIGYRHDLMLHVARENAFAPFVQKQLADPTTDVFTGKPFETGKQQTTMEDVKQAMLSMSMGMLDETKVDEMIETQISSIMAENPSYTREDAEKALIEQFDQTMGTNESVNTYEKNMRRFGYIEEDNPTSISIYAADFASKDAIVEWIKAYGDGKEQGIVYTDYVGIMMSSISTIIDAISYVLIGFVSISLIVSSIMIGVITYISVLERTKEIGILRSIGASKKDISRVFNAETFIIGLAAGIIGVVAAIIIDIPINLVLAWLAGLSGIAAVPWWGGVGLVVISVILTLIAGIIPSGLAAKKDPVIALRSE